MTISKNAYLTRPEMNINAEYIMGFLLDRGWTKESIAGMLGNMEVESTINPGIWQNLDAGNMALGFGLVQWTPANKYIDWANERTLPYTDMDSNLARILWEVENDVQWIHPTMSFRQFTQLATSPEQCAELFIRHYERPANPNQPERQVYARYWFDNLSGEGGGGIGGGRPFFPTVAGAPMTSEYGWREHPITGDWTFHAGTDWGRLTNESPPIYATQTGEVILNQWSDSGGWMIYIKHTLDPYYSRYLHLESQATIPVGRMVTKGEQIGIMGTTGDSTGIHLHFEVAINESGFGSENGTIDPELYLQMDFGGGVDPDPDPTKSDVVIHLLLSDQLNGWKF